MSLRVDILTLFPEMFSGSFGASIIGRAQQSGAIEIALHNPRDYTHDKHRVVDDYAYGGGPGMVMKPEPLFDCVDAVRAMDPRPARVVLLTPQGRRLDHGIVAELAACERLIILCGHYEGFDERVREHLADDEISIGDYVLSGGEPAAIVLTDAVARYQPGVLGSEQSLEEESHAQGLLEYPQYTRPPEYRGLVVPDVLLSGHHADVAAWRRRQSIERTARRRPDLLARATLTPEEHRWAEEATAAVPSLVAGSAVARVRRIVLMTDSIDRDAAFYATLLATDGARTAPGQHEFALGPTTLSLLGSRIAGLPLGGKADGREDRGPEPSRIPIVLSVPDIKAAHARALTAGCSWLDARIRRQPTSERGFALRDPFGNALVVVDGG